MFDLELHEDDRSGQDAQACCESDDDIIEIDDVSGGANDPFFGYFGAYIYPPYICTHFVSPALPCPEIDDVFPCMYWCVYVHENV